MDEKRVIGSRSVETQQIMALLRLAIPKGDGTVVTYEEMSRAIGQDVGGDARSYVASARKGIEQETGRLFGVVRGEGLMLLGPREQSFVSSEAAAKMNRAAKRAINRAANVQADRLSNEDRIRHNAAMSVMGVIYVATKEKSLAKVAAVESVASDKLAVGDTLKLFEK